MRRPVEKYVLGLHHLAQPTMDPRATLDFYVDTMGAKITHCIASRGWRRTHYDYIHMFLEIGRRDGGPGYPDNIAMFYYFGAKDPSDWPRYGTHHSFAAASIEELDEWEAWLRSQGHEIVWRAQYEIMTSIYVWDPNGRFLEIAAQHRPLNEIDAADAELTAQALCLAADEQAETIEVMWRHKARLVEEREGAIGAPAILFPQVDEFRPLLETAAAAGTERYDRGVFTAVQGNGRLVIERPPEISEAVWWGAGTGGLKGVIERFDDTRLVIAA
jgi:hypothetical protein